MEKEKFKSLGLSDEACDAMERLIPGKPPGNFLSSSLPYMIAGRDFKCSLKERLRSSITAAYLVTMFEKLKHRGPDNAGKGGVWALILTATRDMASSTFEHAKKFFSSTDIVVVLLNGGERELERLGHKKPDAVIVTPDILIQHLSSSSSSAAADGILCLRTVGLLVIDGAYDMLRLGFADCLNQILVLGQLRRDRQTLLFTTELTDEVGVWAKKFLRRHKVVGPNPTSCTMLVKRISSLALGQEQRCVEQPNNLLQVSCPPPSHCSDAKKKKRNTHDGMEEAGRFKKRAENSMDED